MRKLSLFVVVLILVLSVGVVFSQTTTITSKASYTTNKSISYINESFNVLTFPIKAFSFGNTHYKISSNNEALYSYSIDQESYQVFLLPSFLKNLENYKIDFNFLVNDVGSQDWMGFRIMFDNQSSEATESRKGFYIAFFKNGTINFLNFTNNWSILSSTNWNFNIGKEYHVDLYIYENKLLKLLINGSQVMSCEIPTGYWSNGNIGIYTSYANVKVTDFMIKNFKNISTKKENEYMENETLVPFSNYYKLQESKQHLLIVGPEYTISFFKNGGINYIYDQKEKSFVLFNPQSYSNFVLTFFDSNPITLSNAIKTFGDFNGATVIVKQIFDTNVGTIESIYNFSTKSKIISNSISILSLDKSVGEEFSNSSFSIQGILPNQEKSLWSSNVFGMIYSESKKIGFNIAYLSNSDFHSIIINNNGAEIPVQTAGKFLQNHVINIGTMYFWISHGDSLECKSTFWNLFNYLGYKDINPPNISDLKILEVDPGGPITTWFTGIGNFDKLWEYLQPAFSTGFNALWIMPSYRWSGSPYNVEDFYRISSEYGGNSEYKLFIEKAHKKGIYIIQDIVPLGGSITVKDEEIRQWSRYGRDGFIKTTFGHSFNYAAKGWQDYMAKVVQFYTKNFNVNGWRVDTAWENGPESFNWKEEYQSNHRASFASLGGDLEMLKAIFNASKEVTDINPIIIPENYMMSIPEFYKYSNLDYGGGLISNLGQGGENQGFQSLMSSNASPETWAYDIQKYLDEEYYSLPKWAYVMREIANHDTTMKGTFSISVGLASDYYGINRLKAIMALLTFVRGVPMMYMTDWSDIQSYLEEIFKIRSENSALNNGNAIYDPHYVNATNGIIAFLRMDKSQELLVLISMNPKNIKSTVYVNPSLYSYNKLKNIVNGNIHQIKNGNFSIEMPEFSYKILKFTN
ncbi:MAG: alpha-amylase family glycosyl hydrolase [Caldisphaera sp.]